MEIKPPLPTTTLENSRRLRKEMTEAERKLWQLLRGGQLGGLKFRRQHPIPPYIADFCCISKKVIVELDGSQHTELSDAARTRALRSQGWKIIRFWDHDVLLATEAVVEAIWNAMCKPYPHPNPSPDGRGAQASSEPAYE
jgi:very-short-patch-repair endonuclease